MERGEGLLMGPRPAGPEAPERPGRNHQEGAARIGRWREGLGATQHPGTLSAVRSPLAGYKRLTAEVVESRLVPRSRLRAAQLLKPASRPAHRRSCPGTRMGGVRAWVSNAPETYSASRCLRSGGLHREGLRAASGIG